MENEIEVFVKKVNKVFVEHGWVVPKQRFQIFTDSLESHPPSVQLKEINNLRNKIKATRTVIRKTDKSNVFHLGKSDDYRVKVQAYMTKTKAYQELGETNPLESLVERTNSFLRDLWVNKHITQRHYEKVNVNKEEAEIVHLYFLPKTHKPRTPLRPIMSGLKSPTTAISRWLDGILRPLFDRLASETTIANETQLIKQVERWSAQYLTLATSSITMDVTDLYTMIPQEGGIRALKRLIQLSGLKQIDGVEKGIILALVRFVMNNNYFYLNGSYYKQIRGGAMGSSLTLTLANAYMYFVEQPIATWANRTCSLYYRYIDDLFIMSDVYTDILSGLVHFWNKLDENIELSETIGPTAEYLDIRIGNEEDRLVSAVYHPPSHEPYFLPFTSVHNEHIKKNIPFGALVRAIRYSSGFNAFKREVAHICMSLLLNKYAITFILKQLDRVPRTLQCAIPSQKNYSEMRKIFLAAADNGERKARIDFEVNILCHFSFCKRMHDFSTRFHRLGEDCFTDTAICSMKAIVGSRRLNNLQEYLVHKKPNRFLLKICN